MISMSLGPTLLTANQSHVFNVYESLKLFHIHGLNSSLIVCDGAYTNLAVIKATHGHSGAYPIIKGLLL